MPIAIMAGVPQGLSARIKKESDAILAATGWQIKLHTVNAQKASIQTNAVPGLLELASTFDTPHIIGFHEIDGRTAVAPLIREHFRFRWGAVDTLRILGHSPDRFRQDIQEIFDEEGRWRQHVMPQDKSSPLILPQFVFRFSAKHPNVWELAEAYGRENGFFSDLEKKITRFQDEHKKKSSGGPYFMVDHSGLVWKDAGPFHAKTPPIRRWKYSCYLPDCFHYDVEHHKGDAFSITDAAGKVINKKQKEHANIDCHGYHSHGKSS